MTAPEELYFLHLSDIHFRKQKRQPLDLDQDLRNELEADLRDFVSKIRKLEGIWITGDIAFSGSREEYEVAAKWIDKICQLTGCPKNRVWTIPGNHDVKRDGKPLARLLRHSLRTSESQSDSKLKELLTDDGSSSILINPFREYNHFAASLGYTDISPEQAFPSQIGCTTGADQLYWEDSITLPHGYKLNLRGVNSAIVSDDTDHINTAKMLLGTHQLLNGGRGAGQINVLMCHHPVDWLLDQDPIEDLLNNRFHLHLFGHKHRTRISQVSGNVRCCSGAVHPDRQESGWKPSFNFISLTVSPTTPPTLKIWVRIWDESLVRFCPYRGASDADYHTFNLSVQAPLPTPGRPNATSLDRSREKGVSNKLQESTPLNVEDSSGNPDDKQRLVVQEYYRLPYHLQMKIALKLSLVEDGDATLDYLQRTKIVLIRAKKYGVMEQFSKELLSLRESDGE